MNILYRENPEELKKDIEDLNGEFFDLGYNFAIIKIERNHINEIATNKNIQFIELPQNLSAGDLKGNSSACVPHMASTYNLTGKGVIVGFVDSGIDYSHPAFMDAEGNTRIEYIYDLSNNRAVYNKEQINQAVKEENYSIVPEFDDTGHGTHVTGIACGGGKIPSQYRGAAPESSIIMVKGARGKNILSSNIMRGIKFMIDKSQELKMPLIINLSLSTNNGAHNGSTLFEQYIKIISQLENITIIVAAGNEGEADHHTEIEIQNFITRKFKIGPSETFMAINIYVPILAECSIILVSPTGDRSQNIKLEEGYYQGNAGRDKFDIYVSGPNPFVIESVTNLVITSLSKSTITTGIWTIELYNHSNTRGRYLMWLPITEGINPETKFLEPSSDNTIGIPATVANVISVGSYNIKNKRVSDFSGRGNSFASVIKPDIVAPGNNIMGPVPGGGFDTKTGTSMAAPLVAGICALLSEWGIVQENDKKLYGQRMKYYLIREALRERNDINFPNNLWGYGVVCAYSSILFLEQVVNDINAQRISKHKQDFKSTRESNYNISRFTEFINESIRKKYPLEEYVKLLIRYADDSDINEIKNIEGTKVVKIASGEAVVEIKIKDLRMLQEITDEVLINYIPPVYTLTAVSPVEASEVLYLKNNPYTTLNGKDVIVGLIDTGIDYLNKEFIYDNDKTRIISILDQTTGEYGKSAIYDEEIIGTEYTEDDINRALQEKAEGGNPYNIVPEADENGHGTMMASIIGAGGSRAKIGGIADSCRFVAVKLAELNKSPSMLKYSCISQDKKNVYGEPDIIMALRYITKVARKQKKPLVLFIPLGSNMGGHDGTSELEKNLERYGLLNGIIPVVGTGNEGDSQTHTEGTIMEQEKFRDIDFTVGRNQKNLGINIYVNMPDLMEIGIVSPSGEVMEKVSFRVARIIDYNFLYENTSVSIYYQLPDSDTGDMVISVKFNDIKPGTWKIRLHVNKRVVGKYFIWIPQKELTDKDTKFLRPIQSTTLTIPSTSRYVLTTAFYNQENDTVVLQSGKGYTRKREIKPDIASGGINAAAVAPGEIVKEISGSSVAAAVLAGCAAILMQWAVADNNYPHINLQITKSYFIAGARHRHDDRYPNEDMGYGMLSIEGIFQMFRKRKEADKKVLKIKKYISLEEFSENLNHEGKEFFIGNIFVRIPSFKI